MYERDSMYTKTQSTITLYKTQINNEVINQHQYLDKREKISFTLKESIKIREIDKRYTYANPKKGKCTMDCCNNQGTHWLTRNNENYCQSDIVCNQHANIWMQVKDLISKSSVARN